MLPRKFDRVIDLVYRERARQHAKWNEQNHSPLKWKFILDEELGEMAKSYLENEHLNYMVELIQSIAVMVAWAESEFRKMPVDQEENVVSAIRSLTPSGLNLKDLVLSLKGEDKEDVQEILEEYEEAENIHVKFLKVLVENGELPKEIADRLIYGNFGKSDLDKQDDDSGSK